MGLREILWALSVSLAVLSMPLMMRWVKRNWLYGFRTPRTLASDEVWYPANQFAGWAMLGAAAVTAITTALLPDAAFNSAPVFLGVSVGPLLLSLMLSIWYSRKLPSKQ